MKKITVTAPASATIINAISTGHGSAFAINLHLTATAKLTPQQDKLITCNTETPIDTTLMETCIKNTLQHYQIKELDQTINITTQSEIPIASGLSSSSASSNAITLATATLLAEEYQLKPLTDTEILNIAIKSSLESKVTITGSYDDATASYYGGLTITNNTTQKIIHQQPIKEETILIHTPPQKSYSAKVNTKEIKKLKPLIEIAYKKALQKDYYNAIKLNGLLHSTVLGFNNQITIDALTHGAKTAGLTGTGSSTIAIPTPDTIDTIKEKWQQYPGTITTTNTTNTGTQIIN